VHGVIDMEKQKARYSRVSGVAFNAVFIYIQHRRTIVWSII